MKELKEMRFISLLSDTSQLTTNALKKAYLLKSLDLICFLLDLLQSKNNPPKSAYSSPQLTRLKEYLKEHYTEKITVKEVRDHMCMSGDTLNRFLKKETGRALIPLLYHIRIMYSIDLLETTNETVNSIGYMVGFSSGSAFCDIFRREMKTTPLRYRQRMREQKV